jgi:tRNA uridine 5-carboxymethylaminomethyl modification enzyme
MTFTNEDTHSIIRDNIGRSPLYGGAIKGVGPRYCPSIEDKVVRFSDKPRHQVFLEPEGYDTAEYYANGISTSLPADVQLRLVQTIPGLERAEIMRPGYAIEYDYVPPTFLRPTLMTRLVDGLFHAGQINGTSGYEEAAGQGLVAGINAVNYIRGEEPLILGRDEAYIGVMIDDLITRGVDEPYRMFTSRAEFRLILREDNADSRLVDRGRKAGLVTDASYERYMRKMELLAGEIRRLNSTRVVHEGSGMPLSEVLKRPEIDYARLSELYPPESPAPADIMAQAEILIKYEGYIRRQASDIARTRKYEDKRIPEGFDYEAVKGFSNEVREKLMRVRPISIGQAGRIPGVTPAAVDLLLVALSR